MFNPSAERQFLEQLGLGETDLATVAQLADFAEQFIEAIHRDADLHQLVWAQDIASKELGPDASEADTRERVVHLTISRLLNTKASPSEVAEIVSNQTDLYNAVAMEDGERKWRATIKRADLLARALARHVSSHDLQKVAFEMAPWDARSLDVRTQLMAVGANHLAKLCPNIGEEFDLSGDATQSSYIKKSSPVTEPSPT